MRSPDFYLRVSPTLPANYFVDLIARNIYAYVGQLYENNARAISGLELRTYVKQYQSDPQSFERYSKYIAEAEMYSADFTTGRLMGLLQRQRAHYEYQSGMIDLSKKVGAGKKEEAMEVIKKLAELDKSSLMSQPSSEENLLALDEEERKWEESLKNRVPLISPKVNGKFMLMPGITLIGGVTKSGKSTILANLVPAILNHFQDKKIFIISNEDDMNRISSRIACCVLGVPIRKFMNDPSSLPPETVAQVKQLKRSVASRIVVASMPHYDTSNMETVQGLLEEVKADAKAGKYSAILLDYYQIVANSKKFQNVEYVGIAKKFGGWLKGWAADIPIPMILFAQLKPTADREDMPFSQRVQGDTHIANHVHAGLEIVRETDDRGDITKIVCQLSRHGDNLGTVGTFRYNGGQLMYQDKP
jgi:hypothetical protein